MVILRNTRTRTATGLAAAAALLLAACAGGGDGGDSGGGDSGQVLNVWAGAATPLQPNFNPYSPGVQHGALGPVYEPLFYYNPYQAEEPTPMLGTDFAWNDDGTQLSVTLREGVTWNDGEPLTAEDVVYSFMNEVSKSEWLVDVQPEGDHEVVLSFDGPQFAQEYALLGATFIVPVHIWGEMSLDEQTTANNEQPVGTGPYLVKSTSDAAYQLEANPDYWQEGKPAVTNVRYLGIDGNASSQDLLASGRIDWTTMFVPDPEAIASGGGVQGYMNTPTDPVALLTCSNAELGCTGPQTDVAVRQAIDLAIDREAIAERAFVGVAAPISPTFALVDRDAQWIAPGQEGLSSQPAEVDAATEVLEAAGYVRGSDGIYAKDGQRIELTLTSPDGWTDFNDAAKLIEEQAKAAGMAITASTVTWQEWEDSRRSGNYELIMAGITGSATGDPFTTYRNYFTTERTEAAGTALSSGQMNFARYSDPEVDAAVAAAATTNDADQKLAQYAVIQDRIATDLPYIPLVINGTQTFYNSTDFTGWPTEGDMYAQPPAWQSIAAGVVLANLQPVSEG